MQCVPGLQYKFCPVSCMVRHVTVQEFVSEANVRCGSAQSSTIQTPTAKVCEETLEWVKFSLRIFRATLRSRSTRVLWRMGPTPNRGGVELDRAEVTCVDKSMGHIAGTNLLEDVAAGAEWRATGHPTGSHVAQRTAQ